MKCTILHETRGRMRVHTMQGAMSLQQADILEAYLNRVSGVTKATVYDRTGDAVICYDGPRETVTKALSSFAYAKEQAPAPEHSSRALNRDFEDKLVASLCWRGIKQLFVPSSVHALITVARSVPYIKAGLTCLMHRKIQVPVLDATAITVSMLRKDFKTASSIMFLPAGHWRHSRRVDAQEVRCRSRTDHVPECGQGLERDGRRLRTCAGGRRSARRPDRDPYRQRDPA